MQYLTLVFKELLVYQSVFFSYAENYRSNKFILCQNSGKYMLDDESQMFLFVCSN